MAGQLLFDIWGSIWIWVGLGRVSYLMGWVEENRPTDNAELSFRYLLLLGKCPTICHQITKTKLNTPTTTLV